MSIEQTNQLILLILNSALMTMLCAGLLGGAWIRQRSLFAQINERRLRYRQMVHQSKQGDVVVNKVQLKRVLKQLRGDRQRLNNQYLWSKLSTLLFHGSLLLFGISLFALALRSLVSFDLLISVSLTLFTLGAAGLLAGIGCTLGDIAQANYSHQSVGHILSKAIAQTVKRVHPQKHPQKISKALSIQQKVVR